MASNFKDLAIDLWQVRRYENDTISILPIKKTDAAESIKPLAKENSSIKTVQDEIIVFTEESHLQVANDSTLELYESFKNRVLLLENDIELVPKKVYLAFKKENKNLIDLCIQKNGLKLWLNAKWGELNDAKGLARDVSSIGHFGNGDYEITLKDDAQIEYILSLVKEMMDN